MQMKKNKKFLSLILSMMLIVAMAFCTTACGGNDKGDKLQTDTQQGAKTDETAKVLGEGSTVFSFTVVDADSNKTVYEIHTDKTTVGEALLELGLIAGEEQEYGLYVKTVDGVTVDYDKDKKYWAFYVNGEYAMTGVDSTVITPGDTYAFQVE